MNTEVHRILNCVKSDAAKIEELGNLSRDIELARGVLSGKFKFCSCCNDYYLAKSFIEEQDTIPTRVCTYVDIINSGGNEYKDGFADIKYSVCPKGHRHEVSRHERVAASRT